MSVPLDSADKKILLLAVLLLGLLTLLAVLFSPNNRGASRGYPSSYSAAPDGAKAAYTLLVEMGYGVERWERPPEDLPNSARNIVLIIAGPVLPPSKDDMTRLRQFVAAGGHLLITGVGGAAMIGAKDVVPPRSRTHGRPSPPKRPRRLRVMRRRSPWKLRPIGLIWMRASCDTTAATRCYRRNAARRPGKSFGGRVRFTPHQPRHHPGIEPGLVPELRGFRTRNPHFVGRVLPRRAPRNMALPVAHAVALGVIATPRSSPLSW